MRPALAAPPRTSFEPIWHENCFPTQRLVHSVALMVINHMI
jgi:hypothetical protein